MFSQIFGQKLGKSVIYLYTKLKFSVTNHLKDKMAIPAIFNAL